MPTKTDRAPDLDTLDLRKREQWRTWLRKHHASSPGVWFVFHKKHAKVTCVPYEDAVREALCFGWIDSLVKRLDDDRFTLKFPFASPNMIQSMPRKVRPT